MDVNSLKSSGAGITAYGTLFRDNNSYQDKIVLGEQVYGGFFVWEPTSTTTLPPTSGSWQTGQLCYVAGSVEQFYQYNGVSWVPLEGFGTPGKDGADGKDGVTPTIEISADGYWIINGVKTEYKAIGTDGKDGTNGTNGTNGVDGADGKDGVTPTFKVENGELFVSYNSGESWSSLGNVKGEKGDNGTNGTNGTNGIDGINGIDGTSVTITSIVNNPDPGGINYVEFSDGQTLEIKNGLDGKDGADGSGSGAAGEILKSINITKYKVRALSNGQTFKVEPGTLVIISGEKGKQTLVNSSGTVLKDSNGDNLPSFGDGMLFNTDVDGECNSDGSATSDGQNHTNFRSMMMLGASGGLLGTTVTSRNYNATVNNIYIKAGSTQYSTWIFYTALQKDDDPTANELDDLKAKAHTHSFTESGTALTYKMPSIDDSSKTITTVEIKRDGGSQTGGLVKIYSPSGKPAVELWGKTDSTDGKGQSLVRVRAEKDTETVNYRTTITADDITIVKGSTQRSFSNMIPWGYSIQIVTNEEQCTSANVIYLVTG